DPLFWIHLNVEYPFSLKGILYFPKLTHEFESAEGQIKLFNNQVFVADNIKEVIPEYLMLLKGVIDCPDLPLNVSRSFLQNDGQVNKISVHITKKVADKLVSLHNTEKEQYDTYYDDIAPFIEYGCLRDEKFYDKLKPCLQAKDLDGNFVEITKYAEENNKEITYVSDPKMQVQYIKILKEANKNAIILPHIIDTHFISFLEMKEGYKFTRIDSTPENNEGDEEVSKLFSDILGDETLKVTTASLKTNVPAILSEDEQTRRMADITRMFGGGYTAPKTYTLIVNTDSPLTEKVKTIKDEEIKKDICKQIYDIARICHAPLEVDQLAKFIERSTKILEMLADK
ncbi:MAG: molecular chaperone HtpG, partial [Clostridia bacterium]|nr:molecular chaperone HtpG [Clostridia bacterium]